MADLKNHLRACKYLHDLVNFEHLQGPLSLYSSEFVGHLKKLILETTLVGEGSVTVLIAF